MSLDKLGHCNPTLLILTVGRVHRVGVTGPWHSEPLLERRLALAVDIVIAHRQSHDHLWALAARAAKEAASMVQPHFENSLAAQIARGPRVYRRLVAIRR